MARLGNEERQFCKRHGIPIDRLFDASGFSRAEYREFMGDDERWAAYGVTPCRPAGHVLRNRHGACLMCNPAAVEFMKRSKRGGMLYAALGGSNTVMKLGFSQDPYNRIYIANCEGWGGYQDWWIIGLGFSDQAGQLEHSLHAAFKEHAIALDWHRNGNHITTREAYRVSEDLSAVVMEKLYELCDGRAFSPPPGWRPDAT